MLRCAFEFAKGLFPKDMLIFRDFALQKALHCLHSRRGVRSDLLHISLCAAAAASAAASASAAALNHSLEALCFNRAPEQCTGHGVVY